MIVYVYPLILFIFLIHILQGYMMGYDHECRLKYDGYESVTKQCVWTENKKQAKAPSWNKN